MKKNYFLPLTLLLIAFTSCKKDKQTTNDPVPIVPEKKVTWWTMNDDTIKTTETERTLNYRYFRLHYETATNDLAFAIDIDTVGRDSNNDSISIQGVYHGNTPVSLYFNRGGSYIIGPADSGTYLYSTRENGKRKLTLSPTVFRKLSPVTGTTTNDTVIIRGVFYEP